MITYDLVMGKTEKKPITVRVQDLQAGEGVDDATITHTPPAGGAAMSIPYSVETPYINMVFGPFTTAGYHFVKVQAVGDAAVPSKPEVLYQIHVRDA